MQAELNRWAAQAIKHWKQYQPSRYERLKASGKLENEAHSAAVMTREAMQQHQSQGATPDEAWQATRELYLFPPEEQTQPNEPMPESAAQSASLVMASLAHSPD